MEISRRLEGHEARTTANALQVLGNALNGGKKYAEAESAFREGLAIDRRNCDASHWAVREALAGLTKALGQGKDDALKVLKSETRGMGGDQSRSRPEQSIAHKNRN